MYPMEELLEQMIRTQASDLLLVAGSAPTYRVQLRFRRPFDRPLTPQDTASLLEAIASKEDLEVFNENGQHDFAISYKEHRFRVNAYYQRGSVALAIRRLNLEVPTPEELELPEQLVEMVRKPKGLILITGPTGSGKSTTMASLIEHAVNRHMDAHVVTIEDPIEHLFISKQAVISQREVGRDVPSFAEALRVVLRQSPNIIVIGEMRDKETVSAALTAAETGHLVMATLHTPSAAQAVERVIDFFDKEKAFARNLLASVLLGVMAQRLIPTKNGVALVYELMINTPAISNLIREDKLNQIAAYLHSGKAKGMISLKDRLLELLHKRKINQEEMEHYLSVLESREEVAK